MNTARVPSLLLLLAVAALSGATPTLTLAPSYTFTRPASGSATCDIVGTLTGEVGDIITNDAEYNLHAPSGGGNRTSSNVYFSEIQAAITATGTYTGRLIAYTFTDADLLGTYTTLPDGPGIQFAMTSGISNYAPVTVELQAAPEPTSVVALGLGGLALVRRRRRA